MNSIGKSIPTVLMTGKKQPTHLQVTETNLLARAYLQTMVFLAFSELLAHNYSSMSISDCNNSDDKGSSRICGSIKCFLLFFLLLLGTRFLFRAASHSARHGLYKCICLFKRRKIVAFYTEQKLDPGRLRFRCSVSSQFLMDIRRFAGWPLHDFPVFAQPQILHCR